MEWYFYFIFIFKLEATKGDILSSYFWGYLVLQIYAGILATKYNTAYLFFFINQ